MSEPYGYAFQHEETGLQQVVDVQQVEWGFEKNNPRWQKLGPVYLHPPVPHVVGDAVGRYRPCKVGQRRDGSMWISFGDPKSGPHYQTDFGSNFEIAKAVETAFNTAVSAPPPAPQPNVVGSFQDRVQPWMMECFGEMIAGDRQERNHRFLEEALELVQSTGCTADEAHQLVDYVYGREIGDPHQEVGGVMVTLAALCLANALNMHDAAETELARIWTKVEAIRAKHAAKPKHSPLPGPTAAGAHGRL